MELVLCRQFVRRSYKWIQLQLICSFCSHDLSKEGIWNLTNYISLLLGRDFKEAPNIYFVHHLALFPTFLQSVHYFPHDSFFLPQHSFSLPLNWFYFKDPFLSLPNSFLALFSFASNLHFPALSFSFLSFNLFSFLGQTMTHDSLFRIQAPPYFVRVSQLLLSFPFYFTR